MFDKFSIKELLFFILSLQIIGLYGIYASIQHLKICLKDHALIYKKLNRIAGDLPE